MVEHNRWCLEKLLLGFRKPHAEEQEIVWTPGMEFQNLLGEAEFNLVASRNAQAALLKAIKAGQTSVDIPQPEEPSNGETTDEPTGGTDNNGDGDMGA